jgi:hypothetical protein
LAGRLVEAREALYIAHYNLGVEHEHLGYILIRIRGSLAHPLP